MPSQPLLPPDPTNSANPGARTSLLQFPCAFPIKVMGEQGEALLADVVAMACAADPHFDREASVRVRLSAGGRYQGITLTVQATSQAQLDALYRQLTAHPRVKLVL
ncbi:MAG: YbeD family protein [Rhodoferax sp.]